MSTNREKDLRRLATFKIMQEMGFFPERFGEEEIDAIGKQFGRRDGQKMISLGRKFGLNEDNALVVVQDDDEERAFNQMMSYNRGAKQAGITFGQFVSRQNLNEAFDLGEDVFEWLAEKGATEYDISKGIYWKGGFMYRIGEE